MTTFLVLFNVFFVALFASMVQEEGGYTPGEAFTLTLFASFMVSVVAFLGTSLIYFLTDNV